MGLKEGLLCLLAVGDSHGYELKMQLEAATADTWQVNVGQIYTTLQRLERDGLVVQAKIEDGRIDYSVTKAGRNAATQWMSSPVELAVANRDEISLKILMAIRSGIEEPRRVIERQRGATMALLQDYTTLKVDDTEEDIGWLLYLDRLIFSAQAELRWLEKVESRLEELAPDPRSTREIARSEEKEEVTT